MEKRRLGQTDLLVTPITIGAWAYGSNAFGPVDESQAIRTIHAAIDVGINLIDTARGYGESERVVGKALQERKDDILVASKCGAKPQQIHRQIDEALARTGLDHIDLYQVHYPSHEVPIAETMGAMEEIKQAGKIRAIGVSNFWECQLEDALKRTRFDSLQPPYNVFWREIEQHALRFCRENNIAVLPYSPLAQGLLTGKYRRREDVPPDVRSQNLLFADETFDKCTRVLIALDRLANKYGKTLAQVSLNWMLQQPGITSVIIGAKNPEQVRENLGCLGWDLEPGDVTEISDLGLQVSETLDYSANMWGVMPKRPA